MNLYPRYERHLELVGVGEAGQIKLLASKILIVGAGGLGCPTALYLAAAGIGKITLMDDDDVRMANLQRQILYKSSSINTPKVERAAEVLKELNPDLKIFPVRERANESNISELVKDHDLVLDCSDNFETRYMLNKVCVKNRKTLISGSVIYFEGQIYVFKGQPENQYPCYQCLYPVKPEANEAPTCSESAVLGPLPGVIGTLMSVETIKEILNLGDSLAGYFIAYSGLTSRFDKIKIEKNAHCKTCGSFLNEQP